MRFCGVSFKSEAPSYHGFALICQFRTMRKMAQLRSDVESTIASAGVIEDRLDDWCQDSLTVLPPDGAFSTPTMRSISVLRVASIYCYILIHRMLLKTTLGTPFFDHSYEDAVQYTSRVFFQL